MTPDVCRAIDALVDREMPGLRGKFEATLVPLREARSLRLLGPDEAYVRTPEDDAESHRLRCAIVATMRQVGLHQVGHAPDHGWVMEGVRQLGLAALGVVGWDLETEDVPAALASVLTLAEHQLREDLERTRDGDEASPF